MTPLERVTLAVAIFILGGMAGMAAADRQAAADCAPAKESR